MLLLQPRRPWLLMQAAQSRALQVLRAARRCPRVNRDVGCCAVLCCCAVLLAVPVVYRCRFGAMTSVVLQLKHLGLSLG